MAYMQHPTQYQWVYSDNTMTTASATGISIYPAYPPAAYARDAGLPDAAETAERKAKKKAGSSVELTVCSDIAWLRGRVDEICALGDLKAA